MPINTVTVSFAVTPAVIETAISHYLHRRPLRQKPTAHISYHQGLELIRRFLHYASFHTVEELQAFTSQWVPVPRWVSVEEVEIHGNHLQKSAELLQAELGSEGLAQVGGKNWWQWRQDDAPLKAEWIEMRKDLEERKRSGNPKGQRIMLYVHGGAYFFGSVDEHRYQMQRHARKLKARVLAPRYRLAPQFPFPCGLQDCLAAYLYLLDQRHDPSTILLAGDSAGGGMVLSVMVILRDQGLPLPAGAILLSPWVDLTHSFPSLSGDGKMDYIPAHGFVHKPSLSWPPPNADDLLEIERRYGTKAAPTSDTAVDHTNEGRISREEKEERVRGFSIMEAQDEDTGAEFFTSADGKYSIGPKTNPILSVQLDGKRIQIKDQIQMYAPNHLLTHPLVSPALQPTLGGLPPLLIQTGGGELLHDEQVYLAHKAAQPLAYLPPESNHLSAQLIEEQASKYRPTNVQLQVWEDLCHVAPTLSFTRPAKHMYRSIAQFGAWALARAQKTSVEILDDDSISVVSSDTSSSSTSSESGENLSPVDIKLSMPQSAQQVGFESIATKMNKEHKVGRAGDPLPPFEDHMIRQRIDRHGNIYPLADSKDLVALNVPRIEIGVPKPGPVNKWMAAQKQWNGKFAKQKLKVQKRRLRDMKQGYELFDGEKPPTTALAGRRVKGMKKEKAKRKSWGMALWSLWGSKHDEATLVRQEHADQMHETAQTQTTGEPGDGAQLSTLAPPIQSRKSSHSAQRDVSRSRSRPRRATVTDQGQIAPSLEKLNSLAPPTPGMADATRIAPERLSSALDVSRAETGSTDELSVSTPVIAVEDMDTSRPQSAPTLVPKTDTLSTRPTRGGIAYPFRLKVEEEGRDINASTTTLLSVAVRDEDDKGAFSGDAEGNMDEKEERPIAERFVTAERGEIVSVPKAAERGQLLDEEDAGAQRPGVDRYETAQEYPR